MAADRTAAPGTRAWIPAFAVLFLAYQLPQALRQLGLNAVLADAAMLAFLPVAWAVARVGHRSLAEAYALEWRPHGWRALGVGLLIAGMVKAVAVAAGLALGVYRLAEATAPPAGAQLAAAVAWLALGTFIPSLAEDILTRGFWARWPPWHWQGVPFTVATAAIYLLNHVHRLGNGGGEWLMLTCFGLAYGAACWRAGTLWAAVGLHWGWNFAAPALDFAVPTQTVEADSARLLSAAAHGVILVLVLAIFRRGGLCRPPAA